MLLPEMRPLVAVLASIAFAAPTACTRSQAAEIPKSAAPASPSAADRAKQAQAADPAETSALRLFRDGRQTFRFDTFGDEAFWGDALKLHQAIEGSALGGVGPGVSPATALAAGLKVDVDALPEDLRRSIQQGKVDLGSPATTLALLKLNAVVGVTGVFNTDGKKDGSLRSMGIQCALCHSTVDNSFAPGIGHRLDGWPNRDLDVGAIVNLSPDLSVVASLLDVDQPTVRAVLKSWGPGRFDAALFLDGKAFRPDGKSGATLLPAAFGLAGVNLHTYTGWGSVPYWNAFVAILEMHGKGTFFDPRLDDAGKFPIARRAGSGHVRTNDDRTTAKLGALQFYQLGLEVPRPDPRSFNQDAARRGQALFVAKAKCSTCHVLPLFTEPGWNMHTAEEIAIDDFQAKRSPDERYRTTPLGGLFTRAKGGFYHDGRFATLLEVVNHYDGHGVGNGGVSLGLSAAEKADLVEYLKSL
jgi:hypothetical protein